MTSNPASEKTEPTVSSKVMSVPSRMMKPAAVIILTMDLLKKHDVV